MTSGSLHQQLTFPVNIASRGVHQPNEPDNPIQTVPTQPEAFGLGGGLRISQPEQPNPTRKINN